MSEAYERIRAATHCYLAVKPCGCAPAISIDDGHAGDFVKEMMDEGYHIERLTIEEGKMRFGYDCELCKKPVQEKLL